MKKFIIIMYVYRVGTEIENTDLECLFTIELDKDITDLSDINTNNTNNTNNDINTNNDNNDDSKDNNDDSKDNNKNKIINIIDNINNFINNTNTNSNINSNANSNINSNTNSIITNSNNTIYNNKKINAGKIVDILSIRTGKKLDCAYIIKDVFVLCGKWFKINSYDYKEEIPDIKWLSVFTTIKGFYNTINTVYHKYTGKKIKYYDNNEYIIEKVTYYKYGSELYSEYYDNTLMNTLTHKVYKNIQYMYNEKGDLTGKYFNGNLAKYSQNVRIKRTLNN